MAADPLTDEFEEVDPATAALARLQQRGAKVTNGYRTSGDVDRLKSAGYTPANDGAHNVGDGVDLVPGGQYRSLSQLRVMAAREFGRDAIVQIHNGTHVHVDVPGWGNAPDTTRSNIMDEFEEVPSSQAPKLGAHAPRHSNDAAPHAPAIATGQAHDGDTFRLSTGDNARLYGVDAYELRQQGRAPDQSLVPLGTEARDYLTGHLPGGEVSFTGQSTYGRPVVAEDDSAVGILREGYGLAEPDYLHGDPRFSRYMEAERLARQNRLGGHGTNAETPGQFRHKDGPWKGAEPGVYGEGADAVFADEPTPFQGLRPEIAKGYLQLANDPNATAADLLKYASDNGFKIRNSDAEKFVTDRNKGIPVQQRVTYEKVPRPLTDVGDGATGAAIRGIADPVNLLDELGGIADTVLPVNDVDGPRENIYNSDRRFGDILWNNIDQNRAILENDDAEHGYARFGGQLASGLLIPGASVEGVGGRAAAKALEEGASGFAADQIAKKAIARRLAATGGVEGGVAGFGAGEGGVVDRAPSAALGAAGGAALGVVAPVVLDAAGSALRRSASALFKGRNQIRQRLLDVAETKGGGQGFKINRPPEAAPGAANDADAGESLAAFLKDKRPLHEIYEPGDVLSLHGEVGHVASANDTSLAVDFPDGQRIIPRTDPGLEPAPPELWTEPRPRYANMDAEDGPSVESEELQPRASTSLTDAGLGRAQPHDSGPQPEDFAPAADRMSPDEVVPVPGNRVESAEEAAKANPGSLRDVEAPNELDALEVRTIKNGYTGKPVKYRGPLDVIAFLRSKGGLKEENGELRHMGIVNNKPRDFNRQEWRLGPIVNNKTGLTLDQAGELLWDSGYLHERPTTSDLLDILRDETFGHSTYHPADLNELSAFRAAQAERAHVESTEPPLAEQIGRPATEADMAGIRPPSYAYEDLPGLVDKIGNINLKNIRNAGDIGRAMKRLEDEFAMGAASPVSHAETEALAREMGMSAKELLLSRDGRAFNHAEATAARALLAKSYDEMLQLARKSFNGTDEDKLMFQKAVANVAAIHNKVAGLTREAGRALSAFRIPVDQKTLRGKALKELLEAHGGADNLDRLADGILDLEKNGVTPGGIARFAVQAVKPKWSDKLLALWMFSLLSGPKTHMVNIVSNTLTALGQLPEHGVAAAIGGARAGLNRVRGKATDDRVLYSELGPRAFGLLQGAKEGLLSAKVALKTGETSDSISKLEMSRQQEAFSGVAGHIIHAPTRLLSAEDEFFKSIARRMEINALAVRQARSEIPTPGLMTSKALRQRIAELSANPTEEMTDKAFDYARYLTFQRPLGEKGQALMNLVGKSKLMRIPLPFVRTPTNLLKFAVERSPAAPLLREVREDFKAGGARRDLALAKMMLGSGFGLAISEMAGNGFITGSGPADENTVRQLRADGWQPYSMKLGDHYVSYQRLDPLATTMGVFADFVDLQSAMTEKQRDHIGTLLTTSIIQNLGNKTWLSGLADAFEVYSDPQRRSGPYLNRLAGSVVPAGVAQATQVINPTLREARSMLDAVKARVPGQSSTLLPKRDAYGREITREGGLGPDIISPFAVSTRKHDPVVEAVLDAGAHIDAPNRQIRGKNLSDRDYNRYQALSGRYMYTDIQDAIRDPAWKTMSREDRRLDLESIKKNARADARFDLFGDDSDE